MVHKNVIVMITSVQNDQFWRKNLLETTQMKSKIFRSVIKIHSFRKILKELSTALKFLISVWNGAFRQIVILTKYSTFASSFYIFTWAKKMQNLTMRQYITKFKYLCTYHQIWKIIWLDVGTKNVNVIINCV